MNTPSHLEITEYGNTYRVYTVIDTYEMYKNLYVGLICPTEGPFADLTVNIAKLPAGHAAVDVNNCPWAEKFIKDNHLGEATGEMLESGFCCYPTYKFDMEMLKKYLFEGFDKEKELLP